MSRGVPAFVPRRAKGYTLEMPGICYQIFVTHFEFSSSAVLLLSSAFFGASSSTPYRAPRRASLCLTIRACVSFVSRCVTYEPCVIYHTAAAADRERRTGIYVAFSGARRSLRRLIMVILSRRCKLRRSRARRGPCSGCFAREKVRANRLLQ